MPETTELQLTESEVKALANGGYVGHAEIRALIRDLRAMQAELDNTTAILRKVQEIADRLYRENAALRERLAQQRETIKFWQRHIQRMGQLLGTVAMDTEVEKAVKELRSQLGPSSNRA